MKDQGGIYRTQPTSVNAEQVKGNVVIENLPKLTYTEQEVMQITGLSRTSLWKARKAGKLRACSVGCRRLLFTLEAIEKFLNGDRG